MDKGIIWKSRSQWHSSVVIMTKKDGVLSLCIAFQKWNDMAKFDVFPI